MSKAQFRYGDPIEDIMDEAWNAYLAAADPKEGYLENARRKAGFYSGVLAGLEIARGFGEMFRAVGLSEHKRTAAEFKAARIKGLAALNLGDAELRKEADRAE